MMYQATKQPSKQEDRFHHCSHMVGLAKTHPNKLNWSCVFCKLLMLVNYLSM